MWRGKPAARAGCAIRRAAGRVQGMPSGAAASAPRRSAPPRGREGVARLLGCLQESERLRRFGAQHGLVGERREAGALAFRQLPCGGKGGEVVRGQVHGRAGGRVLASGSAPRPATRRARCGRRPASAAANSRSGARKSAACSEASAPTTPTRVSGEVVALGQHLRADQDVGLAPWMGRAAPASADACARLSRSTRSTRACGKQLGQRFLQPLRAAAEGLDVLVAAARAGTRHRLLRAAVVAAQAAVHQVHHQVGRAAGAAADPAAGRAGQHRRVAAAVEEHQALLAALERSRDRPQRSLRPSSQRCAVSMQRTAGSASATARVVSSAAVAAAPAPRTSFRARAWPSRARPARFALARAPDRDVARRIAHAFLLLERGVVLLVDHDAGPAAAAARTPPAGCRARCRPRR
jgi:hypothetical protein